MEIVLKRIKRDKFDKLMEDTVDKFNKGISFKISDEELESNSEEVTIKGNLIKMSYDIDGYLDIANSELPTYKKLAQIGMKIHKDTKDVNLVPIPTNIMYEKEVWTYLSFKLFYDVVKTIRMKEDEKMSEDKIQRFFFNVGNTNHKRSRTGLLFIWSMVDILESEDDEEMTTTAFHFIDPVKAIYERTLSKNPVVLKAFVKAIINNGCDPRIKNSKYKTKIPKNISCFARINILDAYEYDELVLEMENQVKEILSVS